MVHGTTSIVQPTDSDSNKSIMPTKAEIRKPPNVTVNAAVAAAINASAAPINTMNAAASAPVHGAPQHQPSIPVNQAPNAPKTHMAPRGRGRGKSSRRHAHHAGHPSHAHHNVPHRHHHHHHEATGVAIEEKALEGEDIPTDNITDVAEAMDVADEGLDGLDGMEGDEAHRGKLENNFVPHSHSAKKVVVDHHHHHHHRPHLKQNIQKPTRQEEGKERIGGNEQDQLQHSQQVQKTQSNLPISSSLLPQQITSQPLPTQPKMQPVFPASQQLQQPTALPAQPQSNSAHPTLNPSKRTKRRRHSSAHRSSKRLFNHEIASWYIPMPVPPLQQIIQPISQPIPADEIPAPIDDKRIGNFEKVESDLYNKESFVSNSKELTKEKGGAENEKAGQVKGEVKLDKNASILEGEKLDLQNNALQSNQQQGAKASPMDVDYKGGESSEPVPGQVPVSTEVALAQAAAAVVQTVQKMETPIPHIQQMQPASMAKQTDYNSFGRDGVEVTNLNSLSEGENWVVCSFPHLQHESHLQNTPHSQYSQYSPQRHPLQISIVKNHRGDYYVDHGHVQGGKPLLLPYSSSFPVGHSANFLSKGSVKENAKGKNGVEENDDSKEKQDSFAETAKESSEEKHEEEDKKEKNKENSNKGGSSMQCDHWRGKPFKPAMSSGVGSGGIEGGVAVLCIDVDNDGNYVAVKDIRLGPTAMQQQYHQDHAQFYGQQQQQQTQPIQQSFILSSLKGEQKQQDLRKEPVLPQKKSEPSINAIIVDNTASTTEGEGTKPITDTMENVDEHDQHKAVEENQSNTRLDQEQKEMNLADLIEFFIVRRKPQRKTDDKKKTKSDRGNDGNAPAIELNGVSPTYFAEGDGNQNVGGVQIREEPRLGSPRRLDNAEYKEDAIRTDAATSGIEGGSTRRDDSEEDSESVETNNTNATNITNEGYNSDDEKDGEEEEEVEDELMEDVVNDKAEVRFSDELQGEKVGVVGAVGGIRGGSRPDGKGGRIGRSPGRKVSIRFHSPPPREADVDESGRLLYYRPEALPRRQLRVLRDGDRILIRYWPNTHADMECTDNADNLKANRLSEDFPCMAKLEYVYGRHYRHRRAKKPKEGVYVGDIPATPRAPSPAAIRSEQTGPGNFAGGDVVGLEGVLTEGLEIPKDLGLPPPATGPTTKPVINSPSPTSGKPRLLSIKSDVKSEEKKRFTLNSTSAAEAPTDDEENAKRAAKRKKAEGHGGGHGAHGAHGGHGGHGHHGGHGGHGGHGPQHGDGRLPCQPDAERDERDVNAGGRKAGKDWSAVESENDGVEGMAGEVGKGGKEEKNISHNDAEEDDDGMEEYSYLTGEVVIKDQDYISAITGDDATMPSAVALEEGEEGEYDQGYDGGDAATASAVVLGTATSPSKSAVAAGRMLRGLRDTEMKEGEREEDECFGAGSCTPKRATSRSHEVNQEDCGGHISRSSGRKSRQNTENLVIEAVAKAAMCPNEEAAAKEGQVEEELALTAPSKDQEESEDAENHSEDELLSQPGDDESSLRLVGAETHDPKAEEGAVIQPNEENAQSEEKDDDETDVSLTQPFIIPKAVLATAKSTQSLSTVEEEELKEELPNVEPSQFVDNDSGIVAAQMDVDGNLATSLFKQGGDDDDFADTYDQPTQNFVIPDLKSAGDKQTKGTAEDSPDNQFKPPPVPNKHPPMAMSSENNALVDGKPTTEQNTNTKTHFEKQKKDQTKAEALAHPQDEKNDASAAIEIPGSAPATNGAVVKASKREDKKVSHTAHTNNKRISDDGPLRPEQFKMSPGKKRSRRVAEHRVAAGTAYDNSALQTNVLKTVRSGAIMTGPVGGAPLGVGLSSPRPPHPAHPDLRRAEKDLLTSIALLSNDPNPNPLPDAAASSEETTVCQMDDAELAKEQGSTTATGPKEMSLNEPILTRVEDVNVSSPNQPALDSVETPNAFRDPDIPTEVCFVEKARARNDGEGLTTPHHRSKRKRRSGHLSSERRRGEEEPVRVIFTGISASTRHKRMIDNIGAELVESVEDAGTATHVIVSDGKSKLRRTPKLMICMSKVSKILSIEWLERSSAEQRVLDTDGFLHLDDKEAEKTYNFSMKESIQNGIVARRERGGVLGGWSVYICCGVAGNRAPSHKELHLIIEAAGAKVIESLSDVPDPLKAIVLTSDPCTDAQLTEQGVDRVLGMGAKKCTTTWLFDTVLTQKMADGRENATPHHSVTGNETPQSGRKRKSTHEGHRRRKSTRKR